VDICQLLLQSRNMILHPQHRIGVQALESPKYEEVIVRSHPFAESLVAFILPRHAQFGFFIYRCRASAESRLKRLHLYVHWLCREMCTWRSCWSRKYCRGIVGYLRHCKGDFRSVMMRFVFDGYVVVLCGRPDRISWSLNDALHSLLASLVDTGLLHQGNSAPLSLTDGGLHPGWPETDGPSCFCIPEPQHYWSGWPNEAHMSATS
jgi:hypothetical protein